MQKCPRCQKEKARQSPIYGVLIGFNCLGEDRKSRKVTNAPEFASLTMQTRVQQQRDSHEKDLMPPYTHEGLPSPEFAKANPQKAKELFSEYAKVTGKDINL